MAVQWLAKDGDGRMRCSWGDQCGWHDKMEVKRLGCDSVEASARGAGSGSLLSGRRGTSKRAVSCCP